MSNSAPPPSLGFSVGITGHRADRITDKPAVRARLDEVLRTIQQSMDHIATGHLFQAGRHPLRMVSAIAEGADRMAAEAALDLGETLEVILPFPMPEYEKDFETAESRSEFHDLLGRASALIVLDGDDEDRPRSYEAAGMTLLDNCDLLIAIWDGGPGRGRGGTREIIGQAARRAMPVVVIPPDGSSITIHGSIHGEPMRFMDVPTHSLDILPDIVASLLGTYGDAKEEAEWRKLAEMPPNPLIHEAYPLLLKLAGVRPWFRRKSAAGGWEDPPAKGALAEAFHWWDDAAIRAAQAFRSAVIVNFSLAAMAVVLAASGVLGGHYKWLFVVAEIVTILLLLINAVHAGRMRWQERWLESRQVAELLRVCTMLRSVGIGRGIADPGEGGSNGWYAGAIARSCGMESVDLSHTLTAAEPLITEVTSQANWNESTSHRMHLAAHRIERFGEVLFAAVLASSVGWLILYFTAEHIATDLKYVLTTITAGLPAVATASYGIRVILDFEGIAGRAHQISLGLNALLKHWEASPQTSASLQEFARRAADIMLSDVAAWRLLAEGRRLTIPG
ncbi:DUF4231 domain-containing protein [Altererythrobacter fulvus]|uniref:DUF4231 domain-containing protein n=1 Tax=Caenibius fulvus TaxID=2126012 RepID=UPI00301630EC